MALGDVRLTWKQRKSLHRYLIFTIAGNIAIGLILFLLGLLPSLSVGGDLITGDYNLHELVFRTLALYGFYIFLHNLVGVKLCYNYFHYAEGSRMNLRLSLWATIGLIMALLGCFMASLCFSTTDQLSLQIRQSLTEGMKKYLLDITWKRKIDNIQSHMKCCGIDSINDWHQIYWLQRDLLNLDSPEILEYAELDGRVTAPVVPWSCCRLDVKGPCYHDPLQLPNPEPTERESTYESLNTQGCLVAMKPFLDWTLYSSIALIVLLFVLQISVIILSRLDFTAARNAVALGNRWGASPGWLYGRLDFGNSSGPNLCQIDRKYSGRGDPMIDLKPLVFASDTE